jgi:hypothetical protein
MVDDLKKNETIHDLEYNSENNKRRHIKLLEESEDPEEGR